MRASIVLALLLAGCGIAPMVPPTAHGVPIDPGPRPSDDECARMIRDDAEAAMRIRVELRVDGVPANDLAVQGAATRTRTSRPSASR